MKISFLFTNPKKFNLFSWLIRVFTRSKYSHCAIHFIDNRTNQEMIFEASHGEAHFISCANWGKHNEICNYISFDITQEQYTAMIKQFNAWAESTKYGILNIVGIVVAMVTRLKHNIFADNDETLICSELGALIFLQLFNLHYPKKELDLFTPKDTFHLISGNLPNLLDNYEMRLKC